MRSSLPYFLIYVAALLLPVANVSAADFKVLTQENISNGKRVDLKYKANNFYSTYYIYMNVIRALEIDKRLTSDEISQVISKMIVNLKENGLAQLTVSGYPGAEDLRVTLSTSYDKKNNKPILLLVSNYDPAKKVVVKGDALNNAYGTYYFLIRDKLVKYQLIVNAEEKKQAAKKSTNDLADYYLLDGDSDNDAKGKELLVNGLKKEKNVAERFMMDLTLSEYYLLEKNTREAKKVLEEAKGVANAISDDKKKKSLMNIYQYADDLYKYYMANSQ